MLTIHICLLHRLACWADRASERIPRSFMQDACSLIQFSDIDCGLKNRKPCNSWNLSRDRRTTATILYQFIITSHRFHVPITHSTVQWPCCFLFSVLLLFRSGCLPVREFNRILILARNATRALCLSATPLRVSDNGWMCVITRVFYKTPNSTAE